MKNLFKLSFTLLGFVLALIAFTTNVNASAIEEQSAAAGGGCEGSGYCGTTKNGTHLSGKWIESISVDYTYTLNKTK